MTAGGLLISHTFTYDVRQHAAALAVYINTRTTHQCTSAGDVAHVLSNACVYVLRLLVVLLFRIHCLRLTYVHRV